MCRDKTIFESKINWPNTCLGRWLFLGVVFSLLGCGFDGDKTHTVKLEWSIPEFREDGSVIDLYEIDSYVLRYGTDQADMDKSYVIRSSNVVVSDSTTVSIDSAIIKSIQLEGFPSGTFFFTISAIDINGLQSRPSEPVSLIF